MSPVAAFDDDARARSLLIAHDAPTSHCFLLLKVNVHFSGGAVELAGSPYEETFLPSFNILLARGKAPRAQK